MSLTYRRNGRMYKRSIRKEIIEKRIKMSSEEVNDLSLRICNSILESEEYRNASTILAYMSIRNEVKLDRVIEQALADGKSVYIPKTYGNRRMEFYLYDGEFVSGSFGIKEPKNTEEERRFKKDVISKEVNQTSFEEYTDIKTLIIVPGVAYDSSGHRLGYGGGYYDTYLSDIKGVTSIGVGYSFQLLDDIPINEFDKSVDKVIAM